MCWNELAKVFKTCADEKVILDFFKAYETGSILYSAKSFDDRIKSFMKFLVDHTLATPQTVEVRKCYKSKLWDDGFQKQIIAGKTDVQARHELQLNINELLRQIDLE